MMNELLYILPDWSCDCVIDSIIKMYSVVLLFHHVLSKKAGEYKVFITDRNDAQNSENKTQIENILSRCV